ncbi:phytanoyl-CoA dioxygenase family protein [Streptomyces sp. NPDC002659]|uniref:phytanoyl-CoA dioxygenase family protein n=1 Tax=Streptomyces sp. NPDC002659 TaxID=3364656 RepID=UPI0036C1899D
MEREMTPLESVIGEYEANGFAVLRGVVDQDLIQEIHTHVDWLARKYPGLRPEDYHHPLMRDDAFWVRTVTDPSLADIAETFLGPGLACFTAHYICKPPHDGRAVLWHQDGAYWKLDPMEALTVWLAVDESTTENGCLRMIPGSHRIPIHPPVARTDTPNMLQSATEPGLVEEWIDRAGVVDIELAPGDVSIHHPNLLHYSEPNTSPKRRCGLDIGYMSTSTRISNDGLYLDPILVRGAPVDGVNRYRSYPRYAVGETVAFHGHDDWNARLTGTSDPHQNDSVPGFEESPLDLTHRMMERLRSGTVKR